MNDFEKLSDLLKKVDHYSIDGEANRKNSFKTAERVKSILGKVGLEKLYKNAIPEGSTNTTKRTLFLTELHKLIEQDKLPLNTKNDNDKTINLEKMLGSKITQLFKEAIDEEYQSTNFRNAVFLRSVNAYPGPKWHKRMVLWVGGPSASGKSYGTQAAINKVSNLLPVKDNKPSENLVVSIDGGIEREMSQMNQLILQLALSRGYKGISDLHPDGAIERGKNVIKSHAKIKKYIKSAALSVPTLSLAIPNTFTSGKIGGKNKKQIKKFNKMPNTIQIFSEVITPQESVFRMGNSRAWGKYKGKILINNREIGCESKKYKPGSYTNGKAATAQAKRLYLKYSKDKVCLEIKNDLIFVKFVGNNMIKCTPQDPENIAIKTTQRAFDAWHASHPTKTPSEWLKLCQTDSELKMRYLEPIIDINNLGKQLLNTKTAPSKAESALSVRLVKTAQMVKSESPVSSPENKNEPKALSFYKKHKPDNPQPLTLIQAKKKDNAKVNLKKKYMELSKEKNFHWQIQPLSQTDFNIIHDKKVIVKVSEQPMNTTFTVSNNILEEQRMAFLKMTLSLNNEPLEITQGSPKQIIALYKDALTLIKEGVKAVLKIENELLQKLSNNDQILIKDLERQRKHLFDMKFPRPI